MSHNLLTFCCFWTSIHLIAAKLNFDFNVTDFLQQRRAKRTLIYEGGGDIRFVIGPIFDVDFDDPVKWRSMVVLYNLHGGMYQLPTTPLYPWGKFEDIFARSMRKLQHNRRRVGVKPATALKSLENAAAAQYWSDDARLFVYSVLENFINRRNEGGRGRGSGRTCLLRSICENAQVQQHVGIFAEVLNIILTPGKEEIDLDFHSAYEAGKAGVDCLSLYAACPMGSNILDAHFQYL